jgi:transposase InsO family protein
MPWKVSDAVKERTKFILKWEERFEANEGRVNVSELCRMSGISRETGHRWINRYRAERKLDALRDRSKRPLVSPTKVSDEIEALLVAARKQRPTWGARKLKHILTQNYPSHAWPSPSCITTILSRNGLIAPRKKRRTSPVIARIPFAKCNHVNAVWCIDFKGKFRTRDGVWCHVLTLEDAYARFFLRAEALTEPNGREVERILDGAFQEYGIPEAIRSDNGPPFASTGAGGLTELSVWWLKLGIRLERIEPGKPEQNGRLERLHRTLEEVVGSPAKNVEAQQRALDHWRHDYNHQRPHEALGMRVPADAYERSRRRYPTKLIDCRDATLVEDELYRLDKQGRLSWGRHKILVTSALSYEYVLVERAADSWTHYVVLFGSIRLGTFDSERLDRGLRIPRRRRMKLEEVSGMSLD